MPKLPAKTLRPAFVALIALAALALLTAGGLRAGGGSASRTDLEARLERVLSAVEGAGRVRVLVTTRDEGGGTLLGGETARVVGVVIVAAGARDAATVSRLAHAAGVALDIGQQYIEVFPMEEGEK